MGITPTGGGEVGRGPLARGAAAVYRYFVLEVLLLLTTLPTFAVWLLLARDASNAPLFVLGLLPVGPALVAGLGAVRAWELEPDLAPAKPFWRTYRREMLGTLAWWAPLLALLAVLAVNLGGLGEVAGGTAFAPVTVLLVVLAAVWAGHMLVLQTRFSFRLRDAARIAVIELLPQWRFSLGVLSLLLVLATVAVTTFDVVSLLLLWAAVALLHLLSQPLVLDVTTRFTRRD